MTPLCYSGKGVFFLDLVRRDVQRGPPGLPPSQYISERCSGVIEDSATKDATILSEETTVENV